MSATLRAVLDRQVTEDQMYAALARAARLGGWLFIHHHDSRHSAAGFPDILAIRGGELLAWECKRERGKTTPAQDAWLAGFQAFIEAHDLAGFCEARVVRPADLAACIARLTGGTVI